MSALRVEVWCRATLRNKLDRPTWESLATPASASDTLVNCALEARQVPEPCPGSLYRWLPHPGVGHHFGP